MVDPTKEQATQFAIMLSSGVPSRIAITYFLTEGFPEGSVVALHEKWMRSEAIQAAILHLQGRAWQEMTVEERIQLSIEKHYSEMAYYLYANNYVDMIGAAKTKADTCRSALETKLAGLAGKTDALSRFWDDVVSGRVEIRNPTPPTLPVVQ
jgi:hypothetical protein